MLSRVSIKIKILLSLLVLVMATSVVYMASSYFRINALMSQEIERHGLDDIETFGTLVAPYVFESDYVTVQSIADQLVRDGDIESVAIVEANMKVWISSAGHADDRFASDAFYRELFDKAVSGFRQLTDTETRLMEFAYPIKSLGKTAYLVVATINAEPIQAQAQSRLRDIAVIMVGIMIISSMLAWYLSGKLTRPLEGLMRGTREIANGNLNYRIAVTSEDEFGRLSTSFNDMSNQLERESADLKQAEQKLRDARDTLEVTVENRTHELASTIELLQQEIKNREIISTELENKNAELERFAYTVSHDLKSPLVTINGFIGLLARDLAAEDSVRVNQDLEKIRLAADTMAELLNDLLELSRIGQVKGQSGPCDLVAIVNQARAMLELNIEERGIEFVIDPMPTVEVDASRITEVYQNLIENSVKFMGEQSSPRIHIGAHEKDEMIECFVRDNGVGIEGEFHIQIFDLFERLSNNVEGTGVGLAVVKRIIEVHGGETWVESGGLGQGCCVWFSLPKANVDREKTAASV